MSLKKFLEVYYRENRKRLAKAANTNVFVINNWLCQRRSVIELADGRWMLLSSKQVIFPLDEDEDGGRIGEKGLENGLY